MNALNFFPFVLFGENTGVGINQFDPKNVVGAFIVPAGTSFSQSNTATPAAFLTALVTATSAVVSQRLFPIGNFGEIKDGSEAAVSEKLGYGIELIVRDGTYKWAFRILKGGFWLSRALRAFNGINVDVFFVDANNVVIGQKNVSSTGVVTFTGIPQYQAYQEPFKINDGSKNTIYMQNFSFPGNVFDNLGAVQMNPGDLNNVKGLQNIAFTSATRAVNVSTVKGTIGALGADLGQTLGTALNVATLWRLQDAITGNFYDPATGITSVAFNASTSAYAVTGNTADGAYNSANPVIVSLAPASVLDAASLHYESNTIQTAS
ncbi:MAG: hypothetical protein JWR05_3482 [Mucilaginibacter sp.]|nr:hypothetical protein [Mucilaginibacter sp.]